MATIILTAVGTAIGGPVGGTIGSIVGAQIDAMIFAPKGRRGPRLGELSVQTSSYGTAIARIFGTMRVAGTVIWSTDLKEARSTSGGGKGKPKMTSYSYSASFAVAISGRPIRAVRRIWADGKLLRGAAGDFKSQTGYRLHLGGEDQPVDPLIASAEGVGMTPAYRGVAYALFEDFQLADYGNRIPSLTFEVEADGAPVAIGAIAEELSGGEVVGGATPALNGYAAMGDSVRGAIEALADAAPLSLIDGGGVLTLTTDGGEVVDVGAAEAGARGAAGGGGRTEMTRRAAGSIADTVSVAYHDVARDYQAGLQRATRGGTAHRSEELSLPAALDADRAKAIAEARLAALWTGRASAMLHLPWRRGMIRPGTRLSIEGRAGLWKVERWTLDHMVVSLELLGVRSGPMAEEAVASPGRAIGHADFAQGPTTLRLLDLPLQGDRPAELPLLLAAAAGSEPGWRKAALTLSYDGGASWAEAGATALPAIMGSALTVLPPAGAALFDSAGTVDVELLNDAMWLEARGDDALVGGANMATLGGELIQFGVAEPLGGGRFRLSRLLRGRRGTEWAAGGHVAGEDFVLIDAEALAVIEPPPAMLGGAATLMANGIGDAQPALASRIIGGEAVRPPAPVHLSAEYRGGDLAIHWVRRSRSGWSWLSGSDTPLGEELEAYRLALSGAGFERAVTLGGPAYLYTAAEQAEDGAAGALTISVTQIGTLASSRPATLIVTPQT